MTNEANTTPDDHIRVIAVRHCSSITGRSTLTYHLGREGEGVFHVRVHDNTGSGMFTPCWVSLDAIKSVIEASDDLTSTSFKSIYAGKSVNTAGFLLAVLRDLGLIVPNPVNTRVHQRNLNVPMESVFVPAADTPMPKTAPRRKSKEG